MTKCMKKIFYLLVLCGFFSACSDSEGDFFFEKKVFKINWMQKLANPKLKYFQETPKYDEATEKRIDELFAKKEFHSVRYVECLGYYKRSGLFVIEVHNTRQSGRGTENNFPDIGYPGLPANHGIAGGFRRAAKFITRKEANIPPYDNLMLRFEARNSW